MKKLVVLVLVGILVFFSSDFDVSGEAAGGKQGCIDLNETSYLRPDTCGGTYCEICAGDYILPNGILVEGDNLHVDCNAEVKIMGTDQVGAFVGGPGIEIVNLGGYGRDDITIEGCEISGYANHAIEIVTAVSPQLINNDIHDNSGGVYIEASFQPLLSGNRICGSRGSYDFECNGAITPLNTGELNYIGSVDGDGSDNCDSFTNYDGCECLNDRRNIVAEYISASGPYASAYCSDDRAITSGRRPGLGSDSFYCTVGAGLNKQSQRLITSGVGSAEIFCDQYEFVCGIRANNMGSYINGLYCCIGQGGYTFDFDTYFELDLHEDMLYCPSGTSICGGNISTNGARIDDLYCCPTYCNDFPPPEEPVCGDGNLEQEEIDAGKVCDYQGGVCSEDSNYFRGNYVGTGACTTEYACNSDCTACIDEDTCMGGGGQQEYGDDCNIRPSCLDGEETEVMSVSGFYNSHISLVTGYYDYKVCCPSDFNMVPNPTPADCSNALFSSFRQDNSHFASIHVDSGYTACLDVTRGVGGESFTPWIIFGGECDNDNNEHCMFSIAGPRNAHVGSCYGPDAYSMKFCFSDPDEDPPITDCDADDECRPPDDGCAPDELCNPVTCECHSSGPSGIGWTVRQHGDCMDCNDQGIGVRYDEVFFYDENGVHYDTWDDSTPYQCICFDEAEPGFGTVSAILVVLLLILFYVVNENFKYKRGNNKKEVN